MNWFEIAIGVVVILGWWALLSFILIGAYIALSSTEQELREEDTITHEGN